MKQKTLYSIFLVTLFLSQVFFSYGQQEAQMDVFKNVDSLRNQLLEEGNTNILTLTFGRNPSETYPQTDTCFDCLSGFVFWQHADTIFCKKFNQQGRFKTVSQSMRMDYADLNFSDVFNCVVSSKEILFHSQIRPTVSDLVDTSNYDILLGDTVYYIKAFSCVDCNSTEMTLDFEGKKQEFHWQSIHFDKKSNSQFYFENLNSRIYHLYLLALMNINHYERNAFWEKE
ncbi:MAG: hypothetical protein IT221_04495 [Fluviicola sp.]|nr:hypothetical protein [Fluviicola sp.]